MQKAGKCQGAGGRGLFGLAVVNSLDFEEPKAGHAGPFGSEIFFRATDCERAWMGLCWQGV